MSEQQGGEWSYSESKDWKDGRHRRDNRFVFDHAGEVGSKSTREVLTACKMAYRRAYKQGWIDSSWPETFEDTDLYHRIRSHADTEAFARRTHEQPEKLRAHIGSQSDEVDVSGWQDIQRIREIVAARHLRLYVFGEPGTGKTRSGCLVSRHWIEQRREQNPDSDPIVLTNIRTLAEQVDCVKWVNNWPELQDVIQRDMDDILAENTRPFLFLFDEASSQARGGGKQGHEASTKLATMVYKMRKYGGALCIIGHDGKDLHPAVRELCTVLEKTDKKRARFYETVKNREGRNPLTPEITGWPDSMWSPNDKDPAPWDWSNPESSDDEQDAEGVVKDMAIWTVKKCKEDGLSDRDTAAYTIYGKTWVNDRWSEIQDGQHTEALDRIKEVTG